MNNFLNVIDTFSSIITLLLSGIISYIVAGLKAKTEIKKTLLSFNHQDKQSFQKSFANVIAKSGVLSLDRSLASMNNALDACAVFIAVSPEKYHSAIMELDKAIRDYDIKNIEKARITLIKIHSNTN